METRGDRTCTDAPASATARRRLSRRPSALPPAFATPAGAGSVFPSPPSLPWRALFGVGWSGSLWWHPSASVPRVGSRLRLSSSRERDRHNPRREPSATTRAVKTSRLPVMPKAAPSRCAGGAEPGGGP